MPNWKKLIVSGSDASLNSLNVATSVTASFFLGSASYAERATFSINSDQLDGQDGSYYRDASNINAGTISNDYLPSSISSDITGNAASATVLETPRDINDVSFNGSANITVEPYIEDDNTTNATRYLTFVDNSTAGYKRLNEDSSLTYNPFTNTLTAGAFSGDGSALTGITANVTEEVTVTDTFTNTTSKVVNHNFGTKNVLVSVYDNNDKQIIPEEVTLTDTDNVTITFAQNTSGTAVVAKGGHIVSGTLNIGDASTLNGQSGSYYLDYNNFTNIPSGLVSSSAQVNADSITNFDSNVKTKLNSDNVLSGSSFSNLTFSSTVISGSFSGSYQNLPYSVAIAASDETTDLTTGTSKATFRMPYRMIVNSVTASLSTAPTGSTVEVDINESGTSILSTTISIDAGEKTSETATTLPVISDNILSAGSEITIDVDQIGSTGAGTGLKVYINGVI